MKPSWLNKNPLLKNMKIKSRRSNARFERQEMEVDEAEDEHGKRKMEEMGTHGELLFSLLSKRRKSISSSMSKRRLTSQAKENLEQEKQEQEMLEKDLADLDKEHKDSHAGTKRKMGRMQRNQFTEIPLSPLKKDIFLELSGVVWLPYYLVKTHSGELREIPAFEK